MEGDISPVLEHAMKRYNIPGLSLALVKDGKEELCLGLGRSRGPTHLSTRAGNSDSQNVASSTLFGIGSLTKAFTSTLLAAILQVQPQNM